MKNNVKTVIIIESVLIAILVGSVVYLSITYETPEAKAEIKGLEDKVEFLQNKEIDEEQEKVDDLIKACIQSSNNMNTSYHFLKKQYESLSVQYYSSDDDYLEKENEILRKELDLYRQLER